MQRYVIMALIIAAGGITRVACSQAEVTHEFGVVAPGTVVKHDFVVVNSSEKTIQILSERVTCAACVRVVDAPNEIPAHSSGIVRVELDTSQKRGRVTQKVFIETDQEPDPIIPLVMTGLVVAVWVEPERIDLGFIRAGETLQRPFAVKASGVKDLYVREIRSSLGDTIRANVKDKAFDGGRDDGISVSWGTVRCGASKSQIGHVNATLTVVVADASTGATKELTIGIKAYVTGDTRSKPLSLFFGNVLRNRPVQRTVTLCNEAGMAGGLIEWKTDHDCVVVSEQPVYGRTERQFQVRLHVTGTEVSGIIRGNIIGRISDRDVVAIPYVGYIE